MVAWRARIGLIKPTHRGKSFAYWYKNAPEGVEIVPTFIGFRSEKRESFLEGFKRAEELAVQLKDVGCDIVSVSGTPPFLLKGLDFERQYAVGAFSSGERVSSNAPPFAAGGVAGRQPVGL